MNILLAADGSPCTVKAACFLIEHLNWFQGNPHLHLLHVTHRIPLGHAKAMVGHAAVEAYYQDLARKALAPVESKLQERNIPFTSTYAVGEVAEQIQSYASRHDVDLIVMGSHGHGALVSLVLGSEGSKVLASATMPVLVIR